MNPCFFLLNSDTNHLEFHFRSLNSKETPHKFQRIPYVPNIFEKTINRSRIYYKFNKIFFKQSLTNKEFYNKLFPYDQEIVNKKKNDLILYSCIIPALFFLTTFRLRKRIVMYKIKNNISYNPYVVPFIGIFAITNSFLAFNITLSKQSFFLTGNLVLVFKN
jgi:hypothetical protein